MCGPYEGWLYLGLEILKARGTWSWEVRGSGTWYEKSVPGLGRPEYIAPRLDRHTLGVPRVMTRTAG